MEYKKVGHGFNVTEPCLMCNIMSFRSGAAGEESSEGYQNSEDPSTPPMAIGVRSG